MKHIACSKFWTDLTIRGHLQQITHCCRRTYFPVSLDMLHEYKANLFNSHPLIIDEKRRMIATDELTEGCSSCIESWPNSDWHSWNEWQNKNWTKDELEKLPLANKIQKIEISFSNKFNFSCMYCDYHYSSTWAKITNKKLDTNETWINAVIDYLYEFIDPKKTYKFGFIGGEPLLDLEVLENIEKLISKIHLNSNNEIYVITNLGVKEKTLNNFLNLTKKYPNINWRISASIDSIEKNGEIIRDGLDFKRFFENLDLVVKSNSIKTLAFLPTISALNISSLPQSIKWMLDQKEKIEKISNISVSIGANTVSEPVAMNPSILPVMYKTYVHEAIELLNDDHSDF